VQLVLPCISQPHFFILFPDENPLEPDRTDPRRCRYYITKYFSFFNESSPASIASFHLIQSEHCLYFAMVLGSGSLMLSATMVKKHELTTVVVQSINSLELVQLIKISYTHESHHDFPI
jgi:hypothetical protein